MKLDIGIATAAFCAIFVAFAEATPRAAPAPAPARWVSRQATREQVVARALAVRRGLSRRQNPSARPTTCGTLTFTRYVIRATTGETTGWYPSTSPAYLTAQPLEDGSGWTNARLTSDMTQASFFVLDESSGCGLRDVSNGNIITWAVPASAITGGSVTYLGTDEELSAWGSDGAQWNCAADIAGTMSCTMDSIAIRPYQYGNTLGPNGERNSMVATCYSGYPCGGDPDSYLTFQIIPVY